jgi:hypothetical protein
MTDVKQKDAKMHLDAGSNAGLGREVAFMGTADKEVAGTQRTDDLRRTRDE